jgi:phosphinothricin acetyltransferase
MILVPTPLRLVPRNVLAMTDIVSPPFRIRPSTVADLPAILDIYAHAVRHGTASWEIEPPDLAEMGRRRLSIIEAGYPYLVAERDGDVLGYAYASAYRPRAAYRATMEDSIYIDARAQGQGVGRALLGALLDAAEAAGCRQMVAVIGDGFGGSAVSRHLHERLGFTLIGVARAVGFKHGRWLDQVLMQKALGAGDRAPSPFA